MYSLMKIFLSFSLFFGGINGIMGSDQLSRPNKIPKLFVFGDSYADTGNMKRDAVSWKSPYGITFPGKPSGRYSDGLTSTDFLAKALGAESPYLWRTHGRKKLRLKRGMNFASGGSGVFTADPLPNLTAQVNFMADLLHARRVYTPEEIYPSDVSFISYAGGDYFDFIHHHRPAGDFKSFVEKVVDNLHGRMTSIGGMLFKKIAITSLQPIGCSPYFSSASSFKSCNESYSELVKVHNNSLKKVVAKLNEDSRLRKKGQHYFIIDIHNAFMTILKNKGSTKFKNPLMKPCCEGACARADSKGARMYTLCDDPKSSFFWDIVHPTQEGWKSVYSVIGNPLTES